MIWARFRGVAVLAAALLVIATACGAGTPSGASPSAGAPAAGAPVKGGTLVVAIWQEPANLMPSYQSQTVQSVVLDTIVEGLVRVSPAGEYEPVLAKEVPTVANGGVKVSADGKSMDVTYKLAPGIKWSDGQPLTSADVQFTWKAWMTDPKVGVREGYDQISGVDTPDDLTAVIHYKTIYGPYASRFQRLMAKHALEKDFSKSDYVRKPLGTGPYMITQFNPGESFVVERSPNYRGAGKPYLDKVVFKSVPSSTVAIAQLKAGEVQVMWNIGEAETADVAGDPNIEVVVTTSPYVERIEMNTAENKDGTDPNSKHPVLGDINVRRALISATPKQQIIDKLLLGKAKVGRTVLSIGWAAPKESEITQDGYDPKKANELLDQAGWVRGTDGIRSKNGIRAALTIMTTTGNQYREQLEQVLVTEYKQVGVDLKITNAPSSVFLSGSWAAGDQRKHGSYDLSMYNSAPDIDPQSIINQRYHSKNIPSPANGGIGQNYTRVKNPEMDRLIDEAGSSLDLNARKTAYAKALKILNEEAAIIWLSERADLTAYGKNVQGHGGGNGWRNFTHNIEDWWLSK